MGDDGFPAVLPVYPLKKTLLLPGTLISLVARQEVERRIVDEALAGENLLGLIQPMETDPGGSEEPPPGPPTLYSVGCLGRIMRHEEKQDDGRYWVLVKGVVRFRVTDEAAAGDGYRRVRAEYDEFMDDLYEPEADELDFSRVREAIRARIRDDRPPFDLSVIDTIAGVDIVNALAQILPFSIPERQAILEAASVEERQRVLLELMDMGFEEGGSATRPS